jgi:hypothetical protein
MSLSMQNKKEDEKKKAPAKELKPKNPNTEGTPDDNDPNAQYEDKDES